MLCVSTTKKVDSRQETGHRKKAVLKRLLYDIKMSLRGGHLTGEAIPLLSSRGIALP